MSVVSPNVSDRLCAYAVSLRLDDNPLEVAQETQQLFPDFPD
jgi:hypothetical protein